MSAKGFLILAAGLCLFIMFAAKFLAAFMTVLAWLTAFAVIGLLGYFFLHRP